MIHKGKKTEWLTKWHFAAVIFLIVAISFCVKTDVSAASSFTLEIGKKRQLHSNGGGAPYTWSTSDSSVARIEENKDNNNYAWIIAVGEGTATITLNSSKFVYDYGGGHTEPFTETWRVTVVSPSNNTGTNNSNTGTNNSNTGTNNSAGTQVEVKRVNLNKKNMTVKIGKTKDLIATIRPTGASSNLTWTSNKPQIATVDSNGKVTGIKKGKAKITVMTANGKKATCTVKVVRPEVKKITLSASALVLNKGTKTTLGYTLKPYGSKATVKYISSNPKIVKVNKKGIVRAKKVGTAKITVKVSSKIKAKCKIKVSP